MKNDFLPQQSLNPQPAAAPRSPRSFWYLPKIGGKKYIKMSNLMPVQIRAQLLSSDVDRFNEWICKRKMVEGVCLEGVINSINSHCWRNICIIRNYSDVEFEERAFVSTNCNLEYRSWMERLKRKETVWAFIFLNLSCRVSVGLLVCVCVLVCANMHERDKE